MHNLKDIRKNKDFFKKKFSERNTEINLDSILDLDKENRDLISKKEKLEQEKKIFQNKKTQKILKNQKKLVLKLIIYRSHKIKYKKCLMKNYPFYLMSL